MPLNLEDLAIIETAHKQWVADYKSNEKMASSAAYVSRLMGLFLENGEALIDCSRKFLEQQKEGEP